MYERLIVWLCDSQHEAAIGMLCYDYSYPLGTEPILNLFLARQRPGGGGSAGRSFSFWFLFSFALLMIFWLIDKLFLKMTHDADLFKWFECVFFRSNDSTR